MKEFDELKHLRFGWFVTPEEVEKLSFWNFIKHQRFGLGVGFVWGIIIGFMIASFLAGAAK